MVTVLLSDFLVKLKIATVESFKKLIFYLTAHRRIERIQKEILTLMGEMESKFEEVTPNKTIYERLRRVTSIIYGFDPDRQDRYF